MPQQSHFETVRLSFGCLSQITFWQGLMAKPFDFVGTRRLLARSLQKGKTAALAPQIESGPWGL
jgi:hypothetical protein